MRNDTGLRRVVVGQVEARDLPRLSSDMRFCGRSRASTMPYKTGGAGADMATRSRGSRRGAKQSCRPDGLEMRNDKGLRCVVVGQVEGRDLPRSSRDTRRCGRHQYGERERQAEPPKDPAPTPMAMATRIWHKMSVAATARYFVASDELGPAGESPVARIVSSHTAIPRRAAPENGNASTAGNGHPRSHRAPETGNANSVAGTLASIQLMPQITLRARRGVAVTNAKGDERDRNVQSALRANRVIVPSAQIIITPGSSKRRPEPAEQTQSRSPRSSMCSLARSQIFARHASLSKVLFLDRAHKRGHRHCECERPGLGRCTGAGCPGGWGAA